MSKSNIRKITVDPTKCNIDSRRPSVFERLGTKPAVTAAAQNAASDYCRNWALNGNCSYGKSCKYANTHTLISPSKRVKKDNASTNPSLLGEDPFKRLTSKIVKTTSHSPDLNLEEWNQTDLEYEDEKVLERRRQLLQRELELQMKKDKEVHGKEKTKYKKKAMSSSSSSHSSSSSSSSSTSSSDDSSSSSTTDSRKKVKKFKKKHSPSPDFDEDKERRRKAKSPPTSHAASTKSKERTRSESPRHKLPSRAELDKDRHHKKLREHEEMTAQKKSADRIDRGSDRLDHRQDRLDRSDRLDHRKEPEKPRPRPPESDKSGSGRRSSERPKPRSRDRRSRSPERTKQQPRSARRSRSADKSSRQIRHEPLPPPPSSIGRGHADKRGTSRSRDRGGSGRRGDRERDRGDRLPDKPPLTSSSSASGRNYKELSDRDREREDKRGSSRSRDRGGSSRLAAEPKREPTKRERERGDRLPDKPPATSSSSSAPGRGYRNDRLKERERDRDRHRSTRYKPEPGYKPAPSAPPPSAASAESRRDTSPNRREYERAYARLTGSGASGHTDAPGHSRHWDELDDQQQKQQQEPPVESARRYDSPLSERRVPGAPPPGPLESEPLLHHPARATPISREESSNLERPYGAGGSEWDEREWRTGGRAGGARPDRGEGLPPARPDAPRTTLDAPKVGETGRKWDSQHPRGGYRNDRIKEIELADPVLCKRRPFGTPERREDLPSHAAKQALHNSMKDEPINKKLMELAEGRPRRSREKSADSFHKKQLLIKEKPPPPEVVVKEPPVVAPLETKRPCLDENLQPAALQHTESDLSDISDDPDDILNMEEEVVVNENSKYPAKSNDADRDSASVKSQEASNHHPSPKAPLDEALFAKEKDAAEPYGNNVNSSGSNGNGNSSSNNKTNNVEDDSMENMDFEEISDGELEEDIKTSCKGLGDALGVDWESLVKESQPRRPVGASHDSVQDRWQCRAVFQRIGISVRAAGHQFVEELLSKYMDGDESNKLLLNNVAFVHTALARKQLMPNSSYKSVNSDDFLYRTKSEVDADDLENLQPCTSLYEEAKMLQA